MKLKESDLIAWLTSPEPARGIRLADSTGGWAELPYPKLADSALRVAAALRAEGVRTGDVVCVILETSADCLATLFGVQAAGAIMCPIVPPFMQPAAEYVAHTSSILKEANPALTVTSEGFLPLVTEAMRLAGLPGKPWLPSEADEPVPPQPRGDLALLQFTSGSSRTPRGVQVTWDNLAANLGVISRWQGWQDGQGAMASWLPLHHDMGLIGCLLMPVTRQDNLWLMRPSQFIKDPARWIEALDAGKARHTIAPSFGFAYAARRIKPERLAGLDLSEWRTAIVGAELTDPMALQAFTELARSRGFSPDVFMPGYGLAENTLGVTSPGRHRPARMVRPEWASLAFGKPVVIMAEKTLGRDLVEPGEGLLVGHGLPDPVDAIGLEIVGTDAAPLPAGFLGEVRLTGTSVTRGYRGQVAPSSTFTPEGLRTGDAGFIHDGQLFLVGRMGDSLKISGRNVFVEDLEVKLAPVAGVARAQIAVLSSVNEARVGVTVVVEAAPGPWAEAVQRFLREELGSHPSITVTAGRRGLIKHTSSGKPRRRYMWRLLSEGALNVTVLCGPDDS